MKPTFKLNMKQKLAALAVLLLTSVPTQAADNNAVTEPFKMAVIIDEAYGRAVVSGKYEEAINKLTTVKRRARESFSDHVNLCVAYTKSSEIEKARIVCDAAVAHVRKQEADVSRIKDHRSLEVLAYRANLSAALSNRGVLLAATGETALAREDFVAAMSFGTRYSRIAAANLDRLEELSAQTA